MRTPMIFDSVEEIAHLVSCNILALLMFAFVVGFDSAQQ